MASVSYEIIPRTVSVKTHSQQNDGMALRRLMEFYTVVVCIKVVTNIPFNMYMLFQVPFLAKGSLGKYV